SYTNPRPRRHVSGCAFEEDRSPGFTTDADPSDRIEIFDNRAFDTEQSALVVPQWRAAGPDRGAYDEEENGGERERHSEEQPPRDPRARNGRVIEIEAPDHEARDAGRCRQTVSRHL